MTWEEFIRVINYYGESNILGLGFDNSAAITFKAGQFTIANSCDENTQSIHLIGFDSRGLPFHIIKPVAHVHTIIVRDSKVDFNAYDPVSLRC